MDVCALPMTSPPLYRCAARDPKKRPTVADYWPSMSSKSIATGPCCGSNWTQTCCGPHVAEGEGEPRHAAVVLLEAVLVLRGVHASIGWIKQVGSKDGKGLFPKKKYEYLVT